MTKKIAIIGYGYVGKSIHRIFPDAEIYDKFQDTYNDARHKEAVNKCDIGVICVPTPMKEDLSCDISIVEDVVRWLETKVILIKSTIPPGTTDYLKKKYHKRICFSPEYVGMGGYYVPEWKYPHPIKIETHTFVIVGGEEKDADFILNAFMQKLGPAKKYIKTSAINAEATKYMENSWGAMKVSFCNEWYEICKTFGANYNTVRELLLLDNRVEEMHTTVFEEKRGWSGSCYPKDICAIIRASEKSGYNPELLKSVVDNNRQVREKNNPTNWDEYDNRLNKFRFRKEK
jgi:UDPglucose 6-dehydrogenase